MDKKIIYITLFLLLISFLLPATFCVTAKKNKTVVEKDKTPPTGSIVINNEDTHTASTSVSLMLTADDPESGVNEVRYSNNGFWNKPWERFKKTKSWTLTSGEGVKTVHYQIKNNDNLISVTYSDSIVLKMSEDDHGGEDADNEVLNPTSRPTASPEPTAKSKPTPTPEYTPGPTSTPEPSLTPTPTTAPKSTRLTPSPSPKPTSTPKIAPDTIPNTPSTSPPSLPSPSNELPAGGSESTELEKLVIVVFVLFAGGTLIFLNSKQQKKWAPQRQEERA